MTRITDRIDKIANNKTLDLRHLPEMARIEITGLCTLNCKYCYSKELKKLSIFTNFEWDRLNNFKIVPPYVPKIFDVSNVLNMLGTPFEAELDKESKGVEEESSCDVSSRSHSDKSWANEF